MTAEMTPDLMTVLSGLQTTLHDVKAELTAVHAVLQSKPPGPSIPRVSYTVEEVASMLDVTPYTVRDWCRLGRVNASKRPERRGVNALWSISVEEVARYRDEGLLPIDPYRNSRG